MITIDVLHDFFERTRQLYKMKKAPFDIDGTCRWSYFFIDSNKEMLTKLGMHLEAEGYEIIGFLEPRPDDADQKTIYLRADRIEKHSVDSLQKRNDMLYRISKEFAIQDYDGLDVGPADRP